MSFFYYLEEMLSIQSICSILFYIYLSSSFGGVFEVELYTSPLLRKKWQIKGAY